jgi:hypothetical protein
MLLAGPALNRGKLPTASIPNRVAGIDVEALPRRAGRRRDLLQQLDDSRDRCCGDDLVAANGLRYIVNPPGSTVRVQRRAEIGCGEVDFDAAFAASPTSGST